MKVKRRHEKHKHTENHIAISHGVGVVVRIIKEGKEWELGAVIEKRRNSPRVGVIIARGGVRQQSKTAEQQRKGENGG